MRNFFICIAIASLLALPSCAMFNKEHEDEDEGDEVKVTLDQLPAPVRKTIEEQSAGGKIQEIEKETEAGKTVYEAEVRMTDGKDYEVTVGEDGKLISKEHEQAEDDDDKDDKDDDK